MNKDVNNNIQSTKDPKEKKSFLSNFIQVEEDSDINQPKPEPKKSDPVQNTKVEAKVKQDKPKKEKIVDEKKGLSEDESLLLNTGEGVNLIPKKSVAQVKKEKKKFSFNVSSILSIVILLSLSLGIVLYNIISREQLNASKKRLYEREAELEGYADIITANDEILDRVDLYIFLQKGVFSPKEIIEYIMSIVDRSGNVSIRSIDIGNTLDFEMSGNTTDLSIVAKLWYLLGVDSNIDTVNLESVGKSDTGASFSFRGQLNQNYFIDN